MTEHMTHTLTKLSEAGRVVADPEQDIRGRKVFDNSGSEIGRIDDLLIDPDAGRVHFLKIEHGGILGIGTTTSFVPVETIARITEDEVHLDRSQDHVSDGPRYDPELIELHDHYHEVYGYYGYTPYSVPGYVYPRWPFMR